MISTATSNSSSNNNSNEELIIYNIQKSITPPTSNNPSDTTNTTNTLLEALKSFELVQENIYKQGAEGCANGEYMPCECEEDCGEGCINRLLFVECDPLNCPVKESCKNRRFQQKQFMPVDLFVTVGKGYGLKSIQNIKENSLILEYTGEVLPMSVFSKRVKVYEKEGYEHFYCMSLKGDEMIDATKKGSLARFINHSCKPNCCLQKWVVGKKLRMGVFSLREIACGEELTFDYKFERYNAPAQVCLCGEKECKGFIGKTKERRVINNAVDYIDSEDSDSDSGKTKKVVKGIDNPIFVTNLVKSLLHAKPSKIPSLINKLLLTDNILCLRRFIQLHGLLLLKNFLKTTNEKLKILLCLQKMPIGTRNTLDECGIISVVEGIKDGMEGQVAMNLIEDWSKLKLVYKIPKAPKNNKSKSVGDEGTSSSSFLSERENKINSNNGEEAKNNNGKKRLDSYQSAAAKKKLLSQLPKDWDYSFGANGDVYFFNVKTQQSQWEFPWDEVEKEKEKQQDTSRRNSDDEKVEEKVEEEVAPVIEDYSEDKIAMVLERAKRQREEEEEKLRLEAEKNKDFKKKKKEKKEKSNSTSNNGATSTSSSSNIIIASDKHVLRDELSALVIKYLSKYKEKMSGDEFKKHARKLTHVLIEKESRNDVPIIDKKKVRKFVEGYGDKLVGGGGEE